ncbi:MAG TPA: hypothetical protein VKF32_12280 [Thermoanaerobaculia bacterium]|nr:hypothetical protein [Thermoanaerobaculia bacterium]
MPRPDNGPLLAIVAALPEELAPLRRRLRAPRRALAGGLEAVLGTLGGASVVTMMTGDGRRAAERGVETLLDAYEPEALIGIGVAGALTRDLSRGTLLAGLVRDEDGVATAPDPVWLARAREAGARAGTLVTSREVLTSPARKSSLLATLGASGPAAVDMESIFWARAAASRGVPWVVVRAISDRCDEELPEFLSRCVSPGGGVDRARVARHALRNPRVVPDLLRLKKRVSECAERLAQLAEALAAAPPRRARALRAGEAG